MDWDAPEIEALITSALSEDVGAGDVSVAATIPSTTNGTAHIVTRQEIVCAGLPLVEKILSRLDADVVVELGASEEQRVTNGTVIATLSGNTGAMLTGEQTLLNLLSRLCGIATLTRKYVEKIEGTRAKIRDSRVTTPGLRRIEQYAIHAGGGVRHHVGLSDAILVRPAHIAAAGGIQGALDQAHSHASRLMNLPALSAYEATGILPSETDIPSLPIQIELRNEAEVHQAISAGAASLLLPATTAHESGRLVATARALRGDCVIEISGEIALSEARGYAETGADYLSPRAITAAAPWADLSLLVDRPGEK